jgi:hypothetical protein
MIKYINLLSSWMVEVFTGPDLCECIVEYAKRKRYYHYVGHLPGHGLSVPVDGTGL